MKVKEFDPAVPNRLKDLQEWFGGVIGQPLRKDQTIQPRTPTRSLIRTEAARYVCPSPSLAPYERMQIYNQQYWWRLQKNLADNFPTASGLLGRQKFEQQMAAPYFVAHPPDHWALIRLGPHLADWIKTNYRGSHREILSESALLDYTFNICFGAPHFDPLSNSQADAHQLATQMLYLQPHIRLFSFEQDTIRFRDAIISQTKEGYWLAHPPPKIDRSRRFYYVTLRDSEGFIIWREISQAMHFLLDYFARGSTIDDICEALETQVESIQLEVAANLQAWMQEWVANEWLTLQKSSDVHHS